MSVTKDLIERMFAVGDVHDRRMAELAIEEYAAKEAALDVARDIVKAWNAPTEKEFNALMSKLAAFRGQEASG